MTDTENTVPAASEAPAPPTEITVDIPAQNVQVLDKKLHKLARRARKLGTTVAWVWGMEFIRKVQRSCDSCEAGCVTCNFTGYVTHEFLFQKITVSTASPKFEGWKLLGTLDHSSVEGQVMRRMVPGHECPPEALAIQPGWCAHCNKIRRRTETFVVAHDDGRVTVVGRNCIRDFLGHNSPAYLANALSWVPDLLGAIEEAEGFGTGGYVRAWPLLQTLALVFCVCRTHGGYRSRAVEEFQPGTSTRSVVALVLDPGKSPDNRKFSSEVLSSVTDHDYERAWSALTWLADASGSDFIANLKAVCSTDIVKPKNLGYLCAIVPAYDKEAIKRRERAARPVSEHVGTVGQRQDFGTGIVERVSSFTTDFGLSVLLIIRLESSGALLKWMSSGRGAFEVEKGQRITVRGTVKKHDEYKGVKQTVITRAVLELVEAAK